jgi:hypothetical protein
LTSSASGRPEKRRPSLLVETSLLLTVSFFGTSFVAVKHVVEGVPPILFAAVRFSFAGVLLWLLLHLVEPESKLLLRKDFLPILGLGVVGVTLTQSVFTIGVSLTTAANTALIYSTAPVWGMLARIRPRAGEAAFFGRRRGRAVPYRGHPDSVRRLAFRRYEPRTGRPDPGCRHSLGLLHRPPLFLLRRYSPLALATYVILLRGFATFPLSAFDFGRLDSAALRGSV